MHAPTPTAAPSPRLPTATPQGQLVARQESDFRAVDVAFCAAPTGLGDTGPTGDAAAPAWQLGLHNNATLTARLGRVAGDNATLAALDDPFACRVTHSPARLTATVATLATPASKGARDAFTAYVCPPAAAAQASGAASTLAGYVLTHDAEAGVIASLQAATATATADAVGCDAPLTLLLAPLTAAAVTLQPTATTAPLLPNWTNGSLPSAALAGLCAPLVTSALAGFNATALLAGDVDGPLASLEAALKSDAKTRLWQILGPVGGFAALAALASAATLLRQRRAAGAGSTSAGANAAKPGGDDAAADYVPMLPR